MMSPGYMLEPMKLLMSEENYEIEQRDMLISPESAEDLLAYRKADLIFTIAPIKNRSVVCSHFATVPIALICRENHPRLADTVSLEALYREKFTFTRVRTRALKSSRIAPMTFSRKEILLFARTPSFRLSPWSVHLIC